jgi:MFS family permease
VSTRWLTRNVVVLSGVSFLQDAASELLYPLMPILLTVVLGAPAAVVGVVEGVAEGAAALTKLLAGRLADNRAKRPLIGLGYGMAAVGKALIAVAGAWPVVLAGRVVDRLGKGVRGAPRDALLVAGVPIESRGRVFGLHRAADTAGAVVGPLLGLAGYVLLGHRIRPLLLIAVVPAVLSVLLVAAVRESPPRPAPSPPAGPAPADPPADPPAGSSAAAIPAGGSAPDVLPPGGSVSGAVVPAVVPPAGAVPGPARHYRRVLVVLVAFSLINFPDALLLLRLHEIGFGVTGIFGAYVAYNAVYALASYPAGALADRWPRHRVYALGMACFAAAYLGLGLTTAKPWAVGLLLVYGGFAACTDGVGKAWISSLVPETRQAGAQGLFQGLTGGAVLVAGLWAGLAWGGSGAVPLVLSGAVAVVLAALLATGRVAA